MILKNISNELGKYAEGVTIETTLTDHPISNPREWVEKPKRRDGTIDPVQSAGFDEKDKSAATKVVIKPGETKEFKNEEQAEHIYMTYGDKELRADERGAKTRNWLIQIDKEGNEMKGANTLHAKYRENVSL